MYVSLSDCSLKDCNNFHFILWIQSSHSVCFVVVCFVMNSHDSLYSQLFISFSSIVHHHLTHILISPSLHLFFSFIFIIINVLYKISTTKYCPNYYIWLFLTLTKWMSILQFPPLEKRSHVLRYKYFSIHFASPFISLFSFLYHIINKGTFIIINIIRLSFLPLFICFIFMNR